MDLCRTKGKIKHLEKEGSRWADITGGDLQDKVGLEKILANPASGQSTPMVPTLSTVESKQHIWFSEFSSLVLST